MKRLFTPFYVQQSRNTIYTLAFRERPLSTAVLSNYNKKRSSTFLCVPLLLSNSMEKSKDFKENEYITRQKYSTKITEQKEKFLHMPLKEKRKLYKCDDKYKTLDDVVTWEQYFNDDKKSLMRRVAKKNLAKAFGEKREVRPDLNKKVSLWKGDITTLEIDAIVNAANESLLGGGGVDGSIHRAAGKKLVDECATLRGCKTGDAKMTAGYKLPAKYVIHTVGPIGEQKSLLQSAYASCLELVTDNKLVSVAFPCISTGIYGYANEKAAPVSIETVRNWLEDDNISKNVERVIFCLFLRKDVDIYEELMQHFFPVGLEYNDRIEKEDEVSSVTKDTDEPVDIIQSKKIKKDSGVTMETEMKDSELEKETKLQSKSPTVKMEVDTESKSPAGKMEVDTESKSPKEAAMDIDSETKKSPHKNSAEADSENQVSNEKIETKNKVSPSKSKDEDKVSKPLTRKELNKDEDKVSKPLTRKELNKDEDKVSKPLTRKELNKDEDKVSKPLTRKELKDTVSNSTER